MSFFLRLAGGLCLPFVFACLPLAAQEAPPSDPDFEKKVEESRREAQRLYPDLANPDSVFARAAKVVEDYYRPSRPEEFERADYPLKVAGETAKKLRAISPVDPIFSEVVPVFTTKKGLVYTQVTVKKMQREGIAIAHSGGSAFVHRDDLTDPQRGKYKSSWDTEFMPAAELMGKIDHAIWTRDRGLDGSSRTMDLFQKHFLELTKFDFEREHAVMRGVGKTAADMENHRADFVFRLYELAYAAEGIGHREALQRIESELREPVPEPFKSQLKEMREKLKAQRERYEPVSKLFRERQCELLRDGQPILSGRAHKGKLGKGSLRFLSHEHVQVSHFQGNKGSFWVFKIDPATAVASLVPEASKDELGGTVTLRFTD